MWKFWPVNVHRRKQPWVDARTALSQGRVSKVPCETFVVESTLTKMTSMSSFDWRWCGNTDGSGGLALLRVHSEIWSNVTLRSLDLPPIRAHHVTLKHVPMVANNASYLMNATTPLTTVTPLILRIYKIESDTTTDVDNFWCQYHLFYVSRHSRVTSLKWQILLTVYNQRGLTINMFHTPTPPITFSTCQDTRVTLQQCQSLWQYKSKGRYY